MRRLMVIGTALAALVAVGAAGAGGAADAARPPAAGKFNCVIRNIYFDVTGIELTERMTAHWHSTDENGGTADADTVQTGTVSWHRAHSTKAERRKYRQIATFEELTGDCRVPNFRQGDISGKAQGVRYHVDGTWTAGGQSGTCTNDVTSTRQVSGHFDRLSLATKPPSRKIEVKLVFGGPAEVDCPFAGNHLREYQLDYKPFTVTIPKTRVIGRRIVKVPFHLTSDGVDPRHSAGGPLWAHGDLKPSLTLDGTITLTRYKDCTIRSLSDILHTSCPYPDDRPK